MLANKEMLNLSKQKEEELYSVMSYKNFGAIV